MTYLLWQIFACLLGTALLFLALGWLLREWWVSQNPSTSSLITDSERTSWQTSQVALRARLEAETGRKLAAEKALEDSQGQQAKISLLLDQHAAEIKTLAQELTDKDKALEQRDAGVRQLEARAADLEKQLSTAVAAGAEVMALRARVADLETELEAAADDNKRLEDQILQLQAQAAELQSADAELGKLRTYVADIEPKLAVAAAAGAEAVQLKLHDGDLEGELAKRRSVAELDQQLSTQHAQPTAVDHNVPANGKRDDLKKIFGIGPVLEKRLNGLGVYFFRDIANWTTEDIRRYEEHLKEYPRRIERDNWVEGAREQHFKKYGENLLKARSAEA
jgi:predicted flap endonuclease-1-like 5' DNA nuclease